MHYYLVIACDASDTGAEGRSQAARAAPLENVIKMKESGIFIHGGAFIDEAEPVRFVSLKTKTRQG